jgi:predicted amidohydrolase
MRVWPTTRTILRMSSAMVFVKAAEKHAKTVLLQLGPWGEIIFRPKSNDRQRGDVMHTEDPSRQVIFQAALVQLEPAHLDKATNIAKMTDSIREAADAGARLIVFPELVVTGYVPPFDPEAKARFYEASEPIPGPTTESIRRLAAQRNVFVVFGMVERGISHLGPIMFNVSVMVGPNGFLALHRKLHLPGGEKLYFMPGDTISVFDTPLGRFSLLVCYDFWFPEISRVAALKGAQVIIDSANWPSFDTETWYALGPGVAASNVLWFVQVNRAGGEPYWPGFGGSQIIGPSGRVITRGGATEGIAYGEIDVSDVERRRMLTPVLFDRRPELYGPLAQPKD